MSTSPRALWAAAGFVSFAAVAGALYAQHRLGMQPCPWCILQRLLFIGVGVLSLVAAALPASSTAAQRWPARALGVGVGLLSLAGMAAALYQNRVASKSASCDMTLADRIISGLGVDARWPDVFEVRASCADAAVSILGVPFELWSLALFAALGLVALRSLRSRQR